MTFFIGLDLGQTQDPSTVAVVEKVQPVAEVVYGMRIEREPVGDPAYHVRHLERFPLGTTYPAIVDRVKVLLSTPPLAGSARLVVDQTGVGRAVVDYIRDQGLEMTAVTITAGDSVARDGQDYRVPKRDLVGVCQVLLQNGRLKLARDMPLVPVLVKELLDFKVRVTAAANDVFGTWREGQHDDLVLALALAVWYAEYDSGQGIAFATSYITRQSNYRG